MTEHKHAEILRAIADGKEVQFQYPDRNGWFTSFESNPINDPEYLWRVKPEPFAWLESKDFYEICQTYRHAHDSGMNPVNASFAFEELKKFIRNNVELIK